jgi:antitoxin MazE
MKTQIIKIGNSQGVRIPKALLEQSGLGRHVEIRVSKNRIVIAGASGPRAGWAEAFRVMAARGDDTLLDGDRLGTTAFDASEWQWK